jgi:sugar phosphate isomerase/epimerase
MKVGLDGGPVSGLLKIGDRPQQVLEMAREYGFEGALLPSRPLLADEGLKQQVIDVAAEYGLYVELNGSRIDTALSGKSTAELVEGWKPLFPLAAEVGSPVLNTGLGIWPWEGRLITEASRTIEDQIAGGIATLRELAPIAADHGVVVTIHTSHFKADEYLRIVESVDSPYVGLCLDTSNAFLVLEDPTEYARQVAPHVRSTHLKDTCVYLREEGMTWHGGAVLGRGVVDIPAIIEILYQANPDLYMSVEDHWGRMNVPVYDAAFLESVGPWSGERAALLNRYLWEGEQLLRAGLQPTQEETDAVDWSVVFPERQRTSAAYGKQIRDEIVARHTGG